MWMPLLRPSQSGFLQITHRFDQGPGQSLEIAQQIGTPVAQAHLPKRDHSVACNNVLIRAAIISIATSLKPPSGMMISA